MIRVLALITYRIYPTLMGGQKGVALFYEALQKEVTVLQALSTNNEIGSTPERKRVLFTNRLLPLNLLRYGVLKKLVVHEKIQLVIAEHSYAGWIAWLLKKSTGIPFIIHSHNLEAVRFKQMGRWWWRLYETYEKRLHQKADYNFFISDTDKEYAQRHFSLDADKCNTITYGVAPFNAKPDAEIEAFKQQLSLPASCRLFFFNGTLDYAPNIAAIHLLATEVAPRLAAAGQLFQILISGNRISNSLQEFIAKQPHLLFLDYVPDVALVYQSVELFLNPILNNTGVKTKVLEAVANQCTVVSTAAGASGIWRDACGAKLTVTPDGDWDAFANKIVQQAQQPFTPTPAAFFDSYLWSNIAAKPPHKSGTLPKNDAYNTCYIGRDLLVQPG